MGIMSCKFLPLLLLIPFLAAACSGKGAARDNTDTTAETATNAQEYPNYPWPALARLKTGENPIWFEFGQEGPSLIESASAASLTPYVPWPHAKYVTAMAIWNGFLVMAVNRDGFLILLPSGALSQSGGGELILYRSAAGSSWEPYTTESFFIWEDKPADLLYRNDFFGEVTAPALNPQVYTLDLSSPVPVGAYVPALEIFPSNGGSWETELLRRGPDGLWYYRMKEKGQARNATAYFSTADLNVEGKKISFGEWMNSDPKSPLADRGEAPGNIPGSLALVMLPDGRGLFSYGEESEPAYFSLSALDEGFVYTGAALIGNAVVASWEEQQEAGVGAAGFMVVDFTVH